MHIEARCQCNSTRMLLLAAWDTALCLYYHVPIISRVLFPSHIIFDRFIFIAVKLSCFVFWEKSARHYVFNNHRGRVRAFEEPRVTQSCVSLAVGHVTTKDWPIRTKPLSKRRPSILNLLMLAGSIVETD